MATNKTLVKVQDKVNPAAVRPVIADHDQELRALWVANETRPSVYSR